MRQLTIRSIIFLFVLTSYTGCATILTGTHQKISVDSNPKGAIVATDGHTRARTPAVVSLTRWHSGDIVVSKEGYHPKHIVMHRTLNPYALLDLPWFLLGVVPGIVAVGVDIGTGAIWEYNPEMIYADLESKRAGDSESKEKAPETLGDETTLLQDGLLDRTIEDS
ncbi:MAG: PEGA domain-containing protein [Planctomycetota bacterium]|nr:PEGA domain-containing protein [Planctomycetota bacterium]